MTGDNKYRPGQGGVVYGPTLALAGDVENASPELILTAEQMRFLESGEIDFQNPMPLREEGN